MALWLIKVSKLTISVPNNNRGFFLSELKENTDDDYCKIQYSDIDIWTILDN